MRAAVYVLRGNGGANRTCPAMAQGVRACGDGVSVLSDTDYKEPDHDVAIFWGYVQTCQNIMAGYRAAGKPVIYLDLAYWDRATHYKVSVNSRHPTAYFQNIPHNALRRKRIRLDPWRKAGEHILVAGMGAKAAWAEKLEPVESWELMTCGYIRQFTSRPIVYRPKPSWPGAKPIKGALFSGPGDALGPVLAKSWAVVTHHSNVAVDGLIGGVPAFTLLGVATPLASQDLSKIEDPYYPELREQWVNDVSYCQWSLAEMSSGMVWKHLKDEGLIP